MTLRRTLTPLRRTLAPLLADGSELAQVRTQLVRLAEDAARLSIAAPDLRCELVIDSHTWDYLHCNLAAGSPDLSQWDLLARTAKPLGVALVLDGSDS